MHPLLALWFTNVRRPRTFIRAWQALSLLSRFTIVGFTLTAIIGLALGFAVGRELERSALEQEAASAADSVSVLVSPILTPQDFAAPVSAERYASIERFIRERILDTHIVRVKIWNPAGQEVYSNDPSAMGQYFPISDELKAALDGNVGTEISDLSKDENRTERGFYPRLMEIYVPIRIGGSAEVLGAYEIYHDLDVVTPRIAETQRFVWISLFIGFSVLYFALFQIVRRASEELHRQSQALATVEARRAMDRLKTEFVATVSHELRTPLTALVGFSDLLRTDTGDESERREWAEMLHEGAQRLSHLVEELLDVSRIEEGRMELRIVAVDVREAIENVLATYGVRAQRYTLERRYQDPLPLAHADPEKLTQVLTNLVSNALKYSPDGGTIAIAAQADGATIDLSVKDQGLGIPANQLPLVFERFHRIEDERRQDIEGSGLGLFITRQLVELQGGRIWAESPGPNKGSTFHVCLPVARSEMGSTPPMDETVAEVQRV